ncbi:cytochrome P450 CYP82D47 [Morus notabilis]|uniref:cytochrome P450 CYP82D47 n=1 Tax=Morus notabilis TaxID=981085 RepID=UPI000CED34E0|nr:cytochrome P450 CYP82D47 [Morus notabilis]
MDLQYIPSIIQAISTVLAASLFVYFLIKWRQKDSRRTPPEAGGAWPIVGHLHLLAGSQAPHRTLGHMADKYGPIFSIKVGVHRALVVSSWEMAKEFLTTNDKVFANRSKGIASEILAYNYAMFGFSPYGSYWRQVRKIATLELLSNNRLEILSHVRESEVKTAIKGICELWVNNINNGNNNGVELEMKKWFGDITLNVTFRMIVGKRYLEATSLSELGSDDRCRKTLRDFFDLAATFVVSDALPYLRWLDLGGCEKAMKKASKELDQLAQRWLEEHKLKRVSGEVTKDDQDFMDVMLSILDGADQSGIASYDVDTITKAISLALILAGTDTTTATMIWAIALLLNNREALKKAQQELDQHVGKERQVKESDLKNLDYLQAILKETLRLFPAAPLSVPHESTEDCTVAGYHVPARTRLILNLSKLHLDPTVWHEPSEFRPERFLTTHQNVDVRGQNFELIPFGSGRRMCPGVSFALQVLQLTLATLLHGFEIATTSDEPVDMRETVGLTSIKTSPLDVLLIPRLPAEAYNSL